MASIAISRFPEATYIYCDQAGDCMRVIQSPPSSGVFLNELLCCVDRLGNAFDCLLDNTSRNPLDSLGD